VIEEKPAANQPNENHDKSNAKGIETVQSQPSIPTADANKRLGTELTSAKTNENKEEPLKKIERHTLIVA
jgi:hypothetical protein